MEIYCVKCRKKTGTKNVHTIKTKNNRLRLSGNCTVCGRKKSAFIKTGDGLIGKALGLPNGKVPILGDIPLLGNLF